MEINDPGSSRGMSVDKGEGGKHRGNVSSRQSNRTFYVSRDNQDSFHWVSDFTGVTLASVMLSIENNSSTKNLFIEEITVSSDTVTSWAVHKTLVAQTPAGTTLTSVNLNAHGADASDALAFGNALVTGVTNTTTSKLDSFFTAARDVHNFDYGGALILGRGDGVNIALNTAVTMGAALVSVNVHGHFE